MMILVLQGNFADVEKMLREPVRGHYLQVSIVFEKILQCEHEKVLQTIRVLGIDTPVDTRSIIHLGVST